MASAHRPAIARKRQRTTVPGAEELQPLGVSQTEPQRRLRSSSAGKAKQLQKDPVSHPLCLNEEKNCPNPSKPRQRPREIDIKQATDSRPAKRARKLAQQQPQIPQPRDRKRRRNTLDPVDKNSTEVPQKRARKSIRSAVSTTAVNKLAKKPIQQISREARTEFWAENETWPTEEQESTMDRFRDLIDHARARKRSLSRKRSNTSLASETASVQTMSLSRDRKCAPYRHPLFQRQLKDFGSFMDDHELGITVESGELCQQLLKGPQPTPQETLFSNDGLFEKTCKRLKGENETKVALRISQLIVPSAEILADIGAKHLNILRETTNACWANSIPFINPPGSSSSSRFGPRPQPDFGLGFDRDAFNQEQLQKLQPFLGDLLADCSLFAATYQMYFPFLTSEVKCGDGELDVADRQNAYAQSVILRGLHALFQLVGREKELHREINGFSISHNDEDVRIWGHYAVIDGEDVKFYRHLISKFIFAPSGEGDQRWKAYKFVKNVYDLWLPKHFERICSVIDMLPAELDSEISEHALASLPSGLS